MDPNACLNEIRYLIDKMLNEKDDEIDSGDAVELAERVEALDGWIANGGFLPDRWER